MSVYTTSAYGRQPPVIYAGSHGGYPSGGDYYGQPVTYATTHSSGRRHGRHHSVPVVVQPSSYSHSGGHHHSHGSHHHHHGSHHHRSFGERLRRFFGLAPSYNYRYKSRGSSWGFMGYSRRPTYTDAYTGAEVDRHGRRVYRV